MTAAEQKRSSALKFILCLGVVSFFADMTYEGAHSIVGPFLKHLHGTALEVAFVAGVGEMLAASLRLFTGKLADRTRAYWTLAIAGYAVNLIVVPAMALAGSWSSAAWLVVAERCGKALRGPARDVLLSEATAEVGHGWGFGIHAAFDQAGALAGPLLIVGAVAHYGDFGPAFLWLAAPAAGAIAALLVARFLHPTRGENAPRRVDQPLPRVFWHYSLAAGLLATGFVDFAVLSFHIETTGLVKPASIPLLYAGAMAMNGITALIFGKLYDRIGITSLAIGMVISALALPLGFLGGTSALIAGVGCWGTGLGAQDACLRSGISQVVSMNKRGSAFGYFNGIYGVMWFLGSLVMGFCYDKGALTALVAFGIAAQLAGAAIFLGLRKPLEAARY